MEGTIERFDALICSGARRLTGYQRRLFVAEVATELCGGSARQAERRFGWGRVTVEKGLHESCSRVRCLENFAARGRPRSEEKNPQLAEDIRTANRAKRDTKPDEINTIVIIRADRDTDFAKVFEIMRLCKEAGFRKLQLRARQTGT